MTEYVCGGDWGWMGIIMHLAFSTLIVLAAVWLYKAVFRKPSNGSSNTEAMKIVKERYAKEEITAEEYQRMKKELE